MTVRTRAIRATSGWKTSQISRVPTTNPVVFFTIDDGMVRDPAVIDFLRDHHVPVTIFPIPAYVHQDPAYFDAIHSLGASAQDHTVTHPDLRKLAGAALKSFTRSAAHTR